MAHAPVLVPLLSVRQYSGEHAAHAHDHAQVLYALRGRMELEVAGRAAFVDTTCGMVVPAGTTHGFLALPGARLLVIDAPAQAGVERVRRFAVAPAQLGWSVSDDAVERLQQILQFRRVLVRRAIRPEQVARTVGAAPAGARPVTGSRRAAAGLRQRQRPGLRVAARARVWRPCVAPGGQITPDLRAENACQESATAVFGQIYEQCTSRVARQLPALGAAPFQA